MISAVRAAQRLNSRGNPTVQVDVTTDKGEANPSLQMDTQWGWLDGASIGSFRAIVPSGASRGDYEAVELRDGNQTAYNGLGVETAIRNIETIIGPALIENKFDVATELKSIDAMMRRLDGSKDKSNLGANAILGVSMACARAGAVAQVGPRHSEVHQTLNQYVSLR